MSCAIVTINMLIDPIEAFYTQLKYYVLEWDCPDLATAFDIFAVVNLLDNIENTINTRERVLGLSTSC